VKKYANSRFAFQSWKSPRSNSEDSGYAENCTQPENAKQKELREAGYVAAEAWAKLDVATRQNIIISSNNLFLFALVGFIYTLRKFSLRYATVEFGDFSSGNNRRANAHVVTHSG